MQLRPPNLGQSSEFINFNYQQNSVIRSIWPFYWA
jgi:hypothetical protein